MADRGASAAFKTEIALSANRPFHFVKIVDLKHKVTTTEVTVRFCDFVASLTWDDGDGDGPQSWSAAGALLGFSDIEETSQPRVTKCTLALSGVDLSYISTFLAYAYVDRDVAIYKGLIDTSGAIVSDPIQIYGGQVNGVSFRQDPDAGTFVISVETASHWADFMRRPGRHTNDQEQQLHYPGDKGLEFVKSVTAFSIQWGGGSAWMPYRHKRS